MNAAQMVRAMQWVEVSSEYAPDTRRMIRNERIAVTAAVKSGKGIAEAIAQANETAAMWGVDLAAVKMPDAD